VNFWTVVLENPALAVERHYIAYVRAGDLDEALATARKEAFNSRDNEQRKLGPWRVLVAFRGFSPLEYLTE
jgi:hypothetical protein